MKNRIASLFLAFVMLMSLCVSAGAADHRITVQSGGAERFTDVPTSHWAYGYINKVVGSGLFNGRTPTTFEPSSAMTRSQFVMVMARMEGHSDLEGVVTVTRFPDVTSTRRAAGPIKWATDEGIVQGFGDGTFKPDSPITRGQFAALIHRYIVAKRYVNLNVVDPEPAQFTDAASVTNAFKEDVEYARVHGLLTGYSDGTVRAGNPITRAAIAAILARFLDLVTESGYTPFLDGPEEPDTPPVDVPSSYPDIKVTVKNGSHGATPTVTVTRNGAVVAADDVKEGDRVTISHKPDSGYVATVRVRDANKRTVSVNRVDASTSWFYMPKAAPVTVTVTYTKESSGGGGGGGGSTGSSGYSGTPGAVQTYTLTVKASMQSTTETPKPYTGGVLRFSTTPVTAETDISALTDSPLSVSYQAATALAKTYTFYAVLTPDAGYSADCTAAPAAVEATKTDATPAGVTSYKVYKFEFTWTGSTNVIVTPVFTGGSEPTPPAATVNVTATAAWDDSAPADAKSDTAYAPATDIALTVAATAKAGETVGVEVPRYAGNSVSSSTGYFRYELVKVTCSYDGGAAVEVTDFTDLTEETRNYSVKVPADAENGKSIAITAYYKVAENGDINYTFNATLNGEGKGKVVVNGVGFEALEFTATGEQKATVKMRDYVKAYPENDTATNPKWPVSFSVAATPDLNSTWDGKLTVDNVKVKGGKYALDGNETAEISVTFDKKPDAYGFKLTVIGEGTSKTTFNGQPVTVTGTADKNGTYASGLIPDAKPTTLTLTNTANKGWTPDKSNKTSVPLDANKVTEITVVFRNPNAVPVLFTVDVSAGGGSVNMTAPNGAIMTKADGDIEGANLKSVLQALPISSSPIPVSGAGNVYYALSGTIVTLANPADSGKKIASITVTDPRDSSKYSDMSDAVGYSFKLKDSATAVQVANAKVTLGDFQDYEVMATAPVKKSWSEPGLASISTYSTKIGDSLALNAVLKSLNDNKTNSDGIANAFEVTNAGAFLTKYAESQKQRLEDTLNNAVANLVKISDIAETEKAKALDLNAEVEARLPEKDDEVRASFKSSDEFFQKAFRGYTGDEYLAVADLTVEIRNGENSLKKQALAALTAYTAADNMGVNSDGVKAKVSLKTDGAAKITVSADLDGALTPYGPNKSISTFMNLQPMVSVTANLYRVDEANGVETNVGNGQTAKLSPVSGVDAYVGEEPYSTFEATIKEALGDKAPKVDIDFSSLDATAQSKLQSAVSNVKVRLGDVLTESMLNDVIDRMLDDAIVTITKTISSLPEGAPQTTAAFKNLYAGLVKFKGEKEDFIALKTTTDKTSALATLDDDGNLVVDLNNLNAILTGDDTTFEQFISLLVDFRNGLGADIETNGKTAESVISDMITGRVNAKTKSGNLTVNKWGETYAVKGDEAKEVADLLAALIMSDIENTDMKTALAGFEAHGYQSVAFSVGVGDGNVADALKAANVETAADKLEGGQLRVGFKVAQNIKADS